jgi:hypothetical protein
LRLIQFSHNPMTQSQRRTILLLAFLLIPIEVGDANRKEVDRDPIDHTRCDLLTKAMAEITQTSMGKSGPFEYLKGRFALAIGPSKAFRWLHDQPLHNDRWQRRPCRNHEN